MLKYANGRWKICGGMCAKQSWTATSKCTTRHNAPLGMYRTADVHIQKNGSYYLAVVVGKPSFMQETRDVRV